MGVLMVVSPWVGDPVGGVPTGRERRPESEVPPGAPAGGRGPGGAGQAVAASTWPRNAASGHSGDGWM